MGRRAKTLSSLPIEILSLIFSFLDSFDVGRCWIAGDKKLIKKFSRLGVIRSFKLNWNLRKKLYFPGLLFHLSNLESLEITMELRHPLDFHPGYSFDMLPASLRSIVISCFNVEELFRHTKGQNASIPIFRHSAVYDLRNCFPSLKVFKILDRRKSLVENRKFLLPPNLETLDLPSSLAPLSESDVCDLPQNLENLISGFKFVHKSPTQIKFPQKLKFLEVKFLIESTNGAFVRSLPSELRSLVMNSFDKWNEHLEYLPKNLTYLSLANTADIADSAILHLPPHLTYLNLNRSMQLTNEAIAHLPRFLETLLLSDNLLLNDECVPFLPRTLKHADFADNPNFTDNCVTHLPEHLEYLDVGSAKGITFAMVHLLPKSLTQLSMKSLKTRHTTMPFPSGLTHLSLSHVSIKSDSISRMPNDLKYLYIGDSRLRDSHIRNLPCQSLTSLCLPQDELLTDECAIYLPRSLLTLCLESNQSIGDKFILGLPPGLTELDVSASSLFSDQSIPNLPRNLTKLNMSSTQLLTDACIAHFPRTLKHLYLRNVNKFTDKRIKDLPRGLERLYLSNCTLLTNSCMKNMPRGLIALNLRHNTKIDELAILTIPKTLGSLQTVTFHINDMNNSY